MRDSCNSCNEEFQNKDSVDTEFAKNIIEQLLLSKVKMSIGSTCRSHENKDCELFFSDDSDIKISTVTIDNPTTITPETLTNYGWSMGH